MKISYFKNNPAVLRLFEEEFAVEKNFLQRLNSVRSPAILKVI
jgi:hypothetical protein